MNDVLSLPDPDAAATHNRLGARLRALNTSYRLSRVGGAWLVFTDGTERPFAKFDSVGEFDAWLNAQGKARA